MLFLEIGPDTAKGHVRPWKEHGHGPEYQNREYANEKSALRAEKISGQGIVFQAVLMYSILRAVSLCVFTQNPHIHKFLAVFLYGFSRTGSAANSVIGLRRPPSAVCAEGCVAGMCPYCFILHNIWCSFCPFQAAHGLRTRTKVRTKQFPAKDFGAFVVQKIHACCPENSRCRHKRLVIKCLQTCRFYALFAGFCGTRPGSCRNFG